MLLFTPPSFEEGIRAPLYAGHPCVLRYYRITHSSSVILRDGHFVTTRTPSQDELLDLVEGVDFFLGGRTYEVSEDTAALLVADGFVVVDVPEDDDPVPADPPGFGQGGFGQGGFGR